MVRQAGAPNEDNERHSAGIRAAGTHYPTLNLSGVNQSGTFMSSWKRADVAVAHAAPAAHKLHDLASRHSHFFPGLRHLFLVRTSRRAFAFT